MRTEDSIKIKKNAKAGLRSDPCRLNVMEKAVLSLSSFVVMLCVTCSSPLYSFNFWDDANVYLTLGRGILRGLVPYKDLYEQKGPLLYMVHAAAALISQDSFFGVWLIEIGMAVLFSIFAWKTVKLCIDPPVQAVFLMPAVCSAVYTIGMMDFGDSAEELCFPLLTVIVYLVLRDSAEEADRVPSLKSAFIIGLLTAMLFWVKYTFLGPVLGICILMIIWTVKPRAWEKLLCDIGLFLAGFITLSLPILLYFAANGALGDLFTGYFYNNIFFYADKHIYDYPLIYVPVIGKAVMAAINLYKTCVLFPRYLIFIIVSILGVFCVRKKVRTRAASIFFVTLPIAWITLLSRQWVLPYYAYITAYLAPFAVIALTFLMNLITKRLKSDDMRLSIIVVAVSTAALAFNIITCKNTYMMRYKKADYPQYRFAEIIKETPDANVLTYDVMDRGFYLASGILPKTRYYCFLNIEDDWSVILEEQGRLIGEQTFDYIVTSDNSYKWNGYEIIDEVDFVYVNIAGSKIQQHYCLYKKIS